jgi:hypothetical protein
MSDAEGGKRTREELEVDALNAEIERSKAMLAEWEDRAKRAEGEERAEDARFAWNQHALQQKRGGSSRACL